MGMPQGSVLSPFIVIIVDIFRLLIRYGSLRKRLYAGDLILMSKTKYELRKRM